MFIGRLLLRLLLGIGRWCAWWRCRTRKLGSRERGGGEKVVKAGPLCGIAFEQGTDELFDVVRDGRGWMLLLLTWVRILVGELDPFRVVDLADEIDVVEGPEGRLSDGHFV